MQAHVTHVSLEPSYSQPPVLTRRRCWRCLEGLRSGHLLSFVSFCELHGCFLTLLREGYMLGFDTYCVFLEQVGPFFPASNVLFYVGTFIGERLLYLPSVGFCLLAANMLLSLLGLADSLRPEKVSW